MADFNRVILMGNLTRDPEVRYTKEEMPVVHFTIACNRIYTDRNTGEKKTQVSFIPVVVFGNQARNCSQFLQKGSKVLVEGRIINRNWETSAGEKRSRLEVYARIVQFLSRAPVSDGITYDENVELSEEDIVEEPPEPSENNGDVPF